MKFLININLILFLFTSTFSYAQNLPIGFYPPDESICTDSYGNIISCDLNSIVEFQNIKNILGPTGIENVDYSDTILFYSSEFFSIYINEQPIEFEFISAQIQNISLPDNLSYMCNSPDCIFYPNQWGSIYISGTPDHKGLYNLNIEATITLNLSPSGIDTDIIINYPVNNIVDNPFLDILLGDNVDIFNQIVPNFLLRIIENPLPNLQNSFEYEDIPLFLPEGWSMFGYTCRNSQNALEAINPIQDKVFIVKDMDGFIVWPEFNFNNLGDFTYAKGYQIKLSEQVFNFQFCQSIVPFE